MFLNLSHNKLDVYRASKNLALECYRITSKFPSAEKFCMTQQLRRAALSVHLNLAEGCSRKSGAERVRFFEISRGSLVEIDACLDIAVDLKYVTLTELNAFGAVILKNFQMLSKMINPSMSPPTI